MTFKEHYAISNMPFKQWLSSHVVTDEALLMSIGCIRSDGLTATIQYHLTLMNFAVARLSIDPLDFQCSATFVVRSWYRTL